MTNEAEIAKEKVLLAEQVGTFELQTRIVVVPFIVSNIENKHAKSKQVGGKSFII